jgi:hypothetical protein
MKTTTTLINDEQSLVSAKDRFGNSIRTYDDGYGPIFIHRNSMGITGIVRARTWEDAYSICEDEFFPDADMTHEEMVQYFGENYMDNNAWHESFGFRPNGGTRNPIYAKDLGNDYLDLVTPELLAALEITLEIK